MTQHRPDPAVIAAEFAPAAQCLLRDGEIVYANAALGELLGLEPAILEGRALADLANDGQRVRAALEEHDEGRFRFRFDVDGGRGRPRPIESRWRVLEAESHHPVADGEASAPTLVGTLEDVSDRVERERESEMLESMLANLPMSVYFKDRQSRHERVSEHLLCQDADSVITNGEGKQHHAPADVVGKTDFDLYDGDWVADAVAEDHDVMESDEPIVNEITESTTNLGETFFSSTTKAPRHDGDGNVVGIVGITMDVTERMSVQRELERQNERMEGFTEVLTHDLRNPLTVASGYAELLEDRYDDPEIGKLGNSLERMASLIEEIRAFVLEGRTVESPAPVDLEGVSRDAWGCVDTEDATLDVVASHTVRADDCRVQQLLENLFGNAIEHGGADVTVTVGDLADGFYVADDGPGVPEEEKSDVFDRGFSSDADSTGFGLAIVANIADAHDWAVTVTDAADGGACFEFHDVVRVDGGSGPGGSTDE